MDGRVVACVLLGGLSACGISESHYQEASTRAACEWLVTCRQLYDTVDDCMRDVASSPPGPAGCAYDAREAARCVRGLSDLTCDDHLVPPLPDACLQVYTCPDSGADTAQ